MIKEDFAVVSTVRQMVLEIDLASQGNVAAEFVPFRQSDFDRSSERLLAKIK